MIAAYLYWFVPILPVCRANIISIWPSARWLNAHSNAAILKYAFMELLISRVSPFLLYSGTVRAFVIGVLPLWNLSSFSITFSRYSSVIAMRSVRNLWNENLSEWVKQLDRAHTRHTVVTSVSRTGLSGNRVIVFLGRCFRFVYTYACIAVFCVATVSRWNE